MADLMVVFESAETSTVLDYKFDANDRRHYIAALEDYLKKLKTGMAQAYVYSTVGTVRASGTVTCTVASVVDGTDEVVIAGTTLAVEASPATQSEFLKGASNAACATNLAACINAHTTLSKIVRASASAAVVTITAKVPGPIGNLITLTETGNGFAVSGAVLASGASNECDGFSFGYLPTGVTG